MGGFNLSNTPSENNLTIFHQNIRGLSGKIDELLIHMIGLKPHLLCFSEHHIKDIEGSSPHIPSYTLGATYSRCISKCGGVCIFLKESIEYSTIDLSKYCKEQDLEIAALKFKINRSNFIILCGYRSPTGDFQYFTENLDSILSSLQKFNTKIILCGDFNIDYIVNSQYKLQLEYLFDTYNMKDTVHFPTRTTAKTSSLLDNFFIDKSSTFTMEPHINGLSDHDAQVLMLQLKPMPDQPSQAPSVRSFNEENTMTFLNYLSYENWEDVFNESDTNLIFNNFLNTFLRGFNLSFPSHRKHAKKSIKPQWITGGIIISCQRKKELYILNKYTHDQEIKKHYKIYCAILKKVIHTAKRLYYKQFVEKSKNKTKATWYIINTEKGITKQKSVLKKISYENRSIINHAEIADLLNTYFISMADQTRINNIKDTQPFMENSMQYLKSNYKKQFATITWEYVSTWEIEKIIKSLKSSNSAGYDEINTRLLKLVSPYILSPLTHICNSSLRTGIFPTRLKYASVIPIYKKGDTQLMSNYRPISILTTFSKIVEKIIYSRIIKHVYHQQILTSHQFGFRENHSTEQAIFSLINNILEALDNQQSAVGVFCDLHKAFDSVNHQILQKKLHFYGIRGKMEALIKSYLTDRCQKVMCEGISSSWKSPCCGVPQGSIIGPLLFLIYINDLPSVIDSTNTNTLLYADDTSIIITDSNIDTIRTQLTILLKDINLWFQNNLMLLNLEKTQYLEFRTKTYTNKVITNINEDVKSDINSDITSVLYTKFLGLTIDYTLTWKLHINSILKKLASVAYSIRTLKHILSKKTLKMIYLSNAQSLMQYGIIFWGQSPEASRVFLMQKKILRIVYNLKVADSCRNIFIQNKLMTFYSCYIYSLILFVLNNKNLFNINTQIHQHDTRRKNDIHLPSIHLTMAQKGPYFSCIKMFNHLPERMKSLDPMKRRHKKILQTFFSSHPFYSIQEYLEYRE
jgi:exonuclease III